MNRLLRIVLSAALVLAAVSTRAAEGGAGTAYPKAQYPYAELVKQPLTLSAGLIEVNVPVEINLSKDAVGEPWSIPATIDFGVTDDLQIGVFHQKGICLAGEDNGCETAYNDLGARFRYGLHRDPGGQFVLQGGLYASNLEESLYDAFVGAAYKRTMGNLGLVLDVNLAVALNDRDALRPEVRLGGVRGVQYREALLARAELQFQIAEGLAALGRFGYATSIEEPEGGELPWVMPVGFGVEYEIVPRVDVGAEFTFENLLGEDSSADHRSGTVFVRLFL